MKKIDYRADHLRPAEFKRGRSSIFDEARSGSSKTATTDEMIDYLHEIVTNDRRLALREIKEAADNLYDRAHNILHEELGTRKLSGRWVPRLLTVD